MMKEDMKQNWKILVTCYWQLLRVLIFVIIAVILFTQLVVDYAVLGEESQPIWYFLKKWDKIFNFINLNE